MLNNLIILLERQMGTSKVSQSYPHSTMGLAFWAGQSSLGL